MYKNALYNSINPFIYIFAMEKEEITLRIKKMPGSGCLYEWEAEVGMKSYYGTAMMWLNNNSNVSIDWYDRYLPECWEEIEKLIEMEFIP